MNIEKNYDPRDVETDIYQRWLDAGAFGADPAAGGKAYAIVIPPPNVTAALHLGHALNNILQDILIRRARMAGHNTLWMPGTDHAGIATQTVVEKRILAEEGRRRTDFAREAFVQRVQGWKDQYEARIIDQLKAMGCSCDWARTRFTMDDVCAAAVREAFFKLFADGLIYRGKRLVNWDPATQTVLADDEVEHETVQGHFWYLQYPLTEPVAAGQQQMTHVTVATTRPETMLGDTAVAMNPRDPRAEALIGRTVRLPIVGREIPIIADDSVVLPDAESEDEKAGFSTGFLKVTPAHDPTDWDIGQRHGLEVINVLAPDGTISDKHGWDDCRTPEAQNLVGMDRFEAREAVVEWFRGENLLEDVRDYAHEVGHSYRSHVPIEPYLSDQWFIAVKKPIQASGSRQQATGDAECIPGTDVPVNSLAGLALKPLLDGQLRFVPDRYGNVYRAWLENLRDWPISRQLWWGHQIPIWRFSLDMQKYDEKTDLWTDVTEENYHAFRRIFGQIATEAGMRQDFGQRRFPETPGTVFVCARTEEAGRFLDYCWKCQEARFYREGLPQPQAGMPSVRPELLDELSKVLLENTGWVRDVDVLDTWFSSALWPISTMGWPEETDLLKAFYPSDVLCTAREIITLWVSRMVMFGQYFRGQPPFADVYIHAMIQDGQGRKMSKSLGNGIDPFDIIASHGADAMRFTLAYMTTETQDVRMPVEEMALPDGRKANTSPKFDIGRNFCNKLWNASRFALMNLSGAPAWSEASPGRHLADAWMLSRLARTVRDVTEHLAAYRFHEAAAALYRTMWNDFCDWYLEIAKIRIAAGEAAPKAVLAHGLDVLLRLLHPILPFITERIWEHLNAVAPVRGPADSPAEPLLVRAMWPMAQADWISDPVEERFGMLQDLVGGIREARSRHNVPPAKSVAVTLLAASDAARAIADHTDLIGGLANVESVRVDPSAQAGGTDATVLAGPLTALVHGVIDRDAELERLTQQAETLRKGIAGIEAKLANDKFVSRAPPDVVDRERRRLEGLRGELATVDASLQALR